MTTTEKTTTKPASTVKTSSKTSVEPTTTVKASSTIKTTLKTSVKVATSTKASSTAKAATSAKAASTVTDATSTAYPSTSGTKFVVDGTTGYFAGTNAYWISFLTDDADVDLVMSHLSSAGITILRVWGFNDVTSTPSSGTVYFQSFAGSTPTINTGADGLQRLDYVVKSAEAHGIKLIINFVNNWTDYGGMAAYYTYAGITSNNDWYNNTKAQTQYQAYIKAVVSRYPTNSSIFAWELANEPRCSGCDTSIINTWATTTSKYIKSLDPNRMITIGEEGFGLTTGSDGSYPYQMSEGTDFAANLAIETIDFGAFHMYPESWDVTPTLGWGTSWIVRRSNPLHATILRRC